MRGRGRYALAIGLAGLALLIPATAGAQTKGSVGPRVVGGHDASISQYPWQAAVIIDGEQSCGGSLLTSRIVITAGHCVFDSDPDCLLACTGLHPVCNSISDPPPGDGSCKLDPDDVTVILGSSTLSGAAQTGVVGVYLR
jgi:Trypsin